MARASTETAYPIDVEDDDGPRLSATYAISLAVVAVAILGSVMLLQTGLKAQERDATTVNVAGRQRMLSQKIVKHVLMIQDSDGTGLTEMAAGLESDLADWRLMHARLRANGSSTESGPGNSTFVARLFDRLHPHFEAMSLAAGEVVELARSETDSRPSPINDQVLTILDHEGAYLTLMDRVVFAYDEEARQHVAQTRLQLTVSMAFVLVVLVLEALLIFRPAIQRTKRTTSELQTARRRAEALSLHDELTGIPNRRMLETALERESSRHARDAQPLTVIMLDLNYMKVLNDLEGHQRGDACLIDVARVLSDEMRRPGDLVARYGGDEFAVVLPNTDAAGAHHVVVRLKRAVAGLDITMGTPPNVRRLSISAGAATGYPIEGGFDAGALLAEADRRLYCDKASSRLPGDEERTIIDLRDEETAPPGGQSVDADSPATVVDR